MSRKMFGYLILSVMMIVSLTACGGGSSGGSNGGGVSDFLFGADDGSGWKLWSTDGTEAGTKLLKDIEPYYEYDFTPMNNKLYFRGLLWNKRP